MNINTIDANLGSLVLNTAQQATESFRVPTDGDDTQAFLDGMMESAGSVATGLASDVINQLRFLAKA